MKSNLRPIRAMGSQQQHIFFFFFLMKYNKIQYIDLKLKKLQTRTLKESQMKDSKLKDIDSKHRLMKKKPQKLMKESGISKLKEGCSAMGLRG